MDPSLEDKLAGCPSYFRAALEKNIMVGIGLLAQMSGAGSSCSFWVQPAWMGADSNYVGAAMERFGILNTMMVNAQLAKIDAMGLDFETANTLKYAAAGMQMSYGKAGYPIVLGYIPNNDIANKSPATYTDSTGKVYTYSDGGHLILRPPFAGSNARDKAAVALINQINPASIKEGVEYAAVLQSGQGDIISATTPLNIGEPATSVFRFEDITPGDSLAGLVHTHGQFLSATDNFYSPEDLQSASANRVSSYLGTPDGNIYRYDPGSGNFYRYNTNSQSFVPQPVVYNIDQKMYLPKK